MIKVQTFIKIVDNTGVKEILCIRILGSSKNIAGIGDIIIGTVKKVLPKSAIKKSDIIRVLIIRSSRIKRRENGTHISFNENGGILITKENNPLGTRIFGPIAREIRIKGFTKVASLASGIF